MPILNFRDIPPPVKLPSGYTEDNNAAHFDDFEKFAQDFFQTFYDAEICEPVSRGQDKGRDLVIKLIFEGETEKWMISCKHTAHGGNAVTADDEKNLMNRFHRVQNCTRFIGFYSHIASSDLRQTLDDFEKNEYPFKYKIFNNVDIERELLSSSDGKGWFFACRHFPMSFSRLFSRFLMRIEHYKVSDVKKDGERGLRLFGPGGGRKGYDGSLGDKAAKSLELVKDANEVITTTMHEAMFARTMLDISKKWPGCFLFWSLDKASEIQVDTIVPSFSVEDLLAVEKKEGHGSMRLVSTLWSWWNYQNALNIFGKAWHKLGKNADEFTMMLLLNPLQAEAVCNIEERDLLTRFVAFAQRGGTGKSEWDRVASVSESIGSSRDINKLINEELKLFEETQRAKVRKCSDISSKLELTAYYSDSNQLRQKLIQIDERLLQNHYQSFQIMVDSDLDWNIGPGKKSQWFSERLLKKQ